MVNAPCHVTLMEPIDDPDPVPEVPSNPKASEVPVLELPHQAPLPPLTAVFTQSLSTKGDQAPLHDDDDDDNDIVFSFMLKRTGIPSPPTAPPAKEQAPPKEQQQQQQHLQMAPAPSSNSRVLPVLANGKLDSSSMAILDHMNSSLTCPM